MPPLTTNTSDVSEDESLGEIAAKAPEPKAEEKVNGKIKRKAKAEPVNGSKAQEDDEGDDDDEEEEEEVYDVEVVEGHQYKGKNKLLLLVKWLGYDNPEDRTWEPEDSIVANASAIVAKYYESIGGRPLPTPGKRSTSKASTKKQEEEPPTKRQRRGNELEDKDLPSKGNWENEIEEVVSLQRTPEGNLRVMIKLKKGTDVEVSNATAYKRFPQTMLKYYESKLSFHSS